MHSMSLTLIYKVSLFDFLGRTILVYHFYGTSLEVHGLRDAAGSIMKLQLDDGAASVNTSTGKNGGTQVPSLLAVYDGLDASRAHTLTIGWSASYVNGDNSSQSYAYFDHLMISNLRKAQVTTASPSQASPTAPNVVTTIEETGVHLGRGDIAGIVIAVFLVIGIFSAISYWVLRRRRRLFGWRGYHAKRISMIRSSQKESKFDDPPSPATSNMKAHPHLSLPPAYFSEWRNHQIIFEDGKDAKTVQDGASPSKDAFGSVRYLDLESGFGHGERQATDSTASEIVCVSSSVCDKLSVTLSPATPPPALLDERKSHRTQNSPYGSTMSASPTKRISHFSVRVAKRMKASRKSVRIIKADTLGGSKAVPSSAASTNRIHRILPPLPPLPSQQERVNLDTDRRRPPHPTRSTSSPNDASGMTPLANSSIDKSGDLLSVEAGPSSFNSRTSYVAMSVRSLPPPYASHT